MPKEDCRYNRRGKELQDRHYQTRKGNAQLTGWADCVNRKEIYEEASQERQETSPQRQEARQRDREQQEAGREVKRLVCRTSQAATVARNGSNLRNDKHRRAAAKRMEKARRREVRVAGSLT